MTALALAVIAWLIGNFTVGGGKIGFAIFGDVFATWVFFMALVAPDWRRLN